MIDIGLEVNKIYCCDYKERIIELRDESVDMVLTDIPYLLNKDSNKKSIKDYNKTEGLSDWIDPCTLEWDNKDFDIDYYIKQCCRILKKGRSIVVWCSWQQLGKIDELITESLGSSKREARIGIWKKKNPDVTNMDKVALQPYEFFLWNSKGSNCIFNNINGMYIDKTEIRTNPEMQFFLESSPNSRQLSGKHPTSKPEAIFEWLILTYTNKSDIVFDGCIGGGTTAIAAKKSKRQFIGLEKDNRYCDIANSRLAKVK